MERLGNKTVRSWTVAFVLVLRRPRPERIAAPLTQAVGELQGRLAQMADSQAATQRAVKQAGYLK